MKRLNILLLVLMTFGTLASGQEQESAMSGLAVEEAKLGLGVENRMLVGDTTTFTVSERVYLWMKITGGKSDSLTVTWKTGDKSYQTRLFVGGSPWRTWAYKTAHDEGDWTVTVSDEKGTVLKELAFTVVQPKAK